MPSTVYPCTLPTDSAIADYAVGADFFDAYAKSLLAKDANCTAMELALRIFGNVPSWVEFLMRGRNRIVGLFGLKNQGSFVQGFSKDKPANQYQIDDRLGIFTVRLITPDEVLFGDDDKHLDVQISVCKTMHNGAAVLVISTVVHIHNWLGHAYMLFVKPAHKLIAPATLRRGYR